MAFNVDDRVSRIEERDVTTATVLAVDSSEDAGTNYLIAYDEGGQGWWPETSLQAENA